MEDTAPCAQRRRVARGDAPRLGACGRAAHVFATASAGDAQYSREHRGVARRCAGAVAQGRPRYPRGAGLAAARTLRGAQRVSAAGVAGRASAAGHAARLAAGVAGPVSIRHARLAAHIAHTPRPPRAAAATRVPSTAICCAAHTTGNATGCGACPAPRHAATADDAARGYAAVAAAPDAGPPRGPTDPCRRRADDRRHDGPSGARGPHTRRAVSLGRAGGTAARVKRHRRHRRV